MSYLLEHGAVRDVADDDRLTPLDYAKLAGDAEMIVALSAAGVAKD